MSEESEDRIEVQFRGKAAEKIKTLQRETGTDVASLVSGAVSSYSSLKDFVDKDGTVTVVSNGRYYKVKLGITEALGKE
jgi:hypothetical protein